MLPVRYELNFVYHVKGIQNLRVIPFFAYFLRFLIWTRHMGKMLMNYPIINNNIKIPMKRFIFVSLKKTEANVWW
jgi:hypothetical protein